MDKRVHTSPQPRLPSVAETAIPKVATKSGLLLGTDFFNVWKYRRITFRSTSVKKSNTGYEVFGDLTIAGVTRSVVLEAENPAPPQKDMEGETVTGLSATTTIKRSDFNFGTKYPDRVVSDEIKIMIDLELNQK